MNELTPEIAAYLAPFYKAYGEGKRIQGWRNGVHHASGGQWVDIAGQHLPNCGYARLRIHPDDCKPERPIDYIAIKEIQTGEIVECGYPSMLVDPDEYPETEYEVLPLYEKNG